MFKGRNLKVKEAPKVGDHVKLRASVSLYEGRGDYQLIVEHLEQAGFGILQRRFEELKEKLQAEGLFDEGAKQPLPKHIQHLAVITSPTGAAVQDVISVLKRRFPSLPITIIPSAVQGGEAPEQLINAVLIADQSPDYDAILLCRGGGSIEDLWAFNSETLARTIFECEKPIVSAVGHEVDFTIADFVADVRAPTPSAAAELMSPNVEEILMQFSRIESQLNTSIRLLIERRIENLIHLSKRLKHPRDVIQQWHQRLDFIESKLVTQANKKLQQHAQKIELLQQKLRHLSPAYKIDQLNQHISQIRDAITRSMHYTIENKSNQYAQFVSQLDIVSPLATIKRGYSVTRDTNNNIVKSVDQIRDGDAISVQVSDGKVEAQVNTTYKNDHN